MLRAALAAMTLAAPAAASDFALGLPVDCDLDRRCHIQNYVDRDPGTGARDYRCGDLSYDGHNGTDFALPTLAAMTAGVNVLAAASGVVTGTRDGQPDREYTSQIADEVAGRECGNGVMIDHENGWKTQYCHMKSGSVTVAEGDRVESGDVLGQIGLSGKTQFPHLHLSVYRGDTPVDPFDIDATEACGADDAHLWTIEPGYRPGGLLDAGFDDALPDYDGVRAGTAAATAIRRGAPALVLFALGFGVREGDVMELTIDGPEGEVIAERLTLDRTQAQAYRAVGRKSPAGGWPAGRYSGAITLIRDGAVLDALRREISVR